jgi:zinc transport system permease protein
VVAAKVVGIVLVSAFLVIPAASARLLSRRFLAMSYLSVILGVGTAAVGLFASYYLDAPSGATIILAQTAAFILCLGGASLAGRRVSRKCPD